MVVALARRCQAGRPPTMMSLPTAAATSCARWSARPDDRNTRARYHHECATTRRRKQLHDRGGLGILLLPRARMAWAAPAGMERPHLAWTDMEFKVRYDVRGAYGTALIPRRHDDKDWGITYAESSILRHQFRHDTAAISGHRPATWRARDLQPGRPTYSRETRRRAHYPLPPVTHRSDGEAR